MFQISDKSLSIHQIESIYQVTGDIINDLDEYAIDELFSGNEKDVGKILEQMLIEAKNALFTDKGPIKSSSFGYLDKLSTSFDYELKRRSFNYFVTSVLLNFDMSWHHIEWGNFIHFYNRLGIIAARDHSKSHTFSFAYPLWKMYRYDRNNIGFTNKENELNKKGMIITNEHSLSREFMKFIRNEIEENPILRERLYPTGADGWGKEEILCKNGAELVGKGSGAALRGRHPGYIVVDDYLEDSVMYSKNQSDQYTSFFHSTIMNSVLPKGQVIVVGTPFTQNDLYADLKKKKGWKVFEYPAIFPNGSVLWSDRYNLQDLLEKKETQGSIIFSREILVKPITSDSSIFPWSILEKSFIGMDQYTITENINSFGRKFKKVVLGCDFAISSSVGADYTAFVTIGVDDLDNYWVLNMWREKGATYNQQIAQMRKLNNNFRYNTIMAEDNVFQKVMIDIAIEAGLKVIPHTTGVNKYDLKAGLPALATLFEQGRIKMPRGNAHSKEITDIICMEAAGITWAESGKFESVNEHDDSLYALWISIRAAHYVTKSFKFEFI